jgi:hypothetical protein
MRPAQLLQELNLPGMIEVVRDDAGHKLQDRRAAASGFSLESSPIEP